MLERLLVTALIFGGLFLLWLGWIYYKGRLARSIQTDRRGGDRPNLLYFTADYCRACQLQQTPIIENLAGKLGDAVNILRYDVTENPDLASRYKVMTLPTTVVVDQQGKVRHINYGVTPESKLKTQLL